MSKEMCDCSDLRKLCTRDAKPSSGEKSDFQNGDFLSREQKTQINQHALKRYVEQLPECQTFLENFFDTCGQFDYETNLANYMNDLTLYSDRPHIRENQEKLREAFFDIVEPPGLKQAGFVSEIAGYEVVSLEDHVAVFRENRCVAKQTIKGLAKFATGRDLKTGWARTEDFNIIYLYDKGDGFGYAINIEAPELSEWGYVPFGDEIVK